MSTQKSSLAEHLSTSTFILILLGAGLSAPSGIPTFRNNADPNFDPKLFATRAAFMHDPRLVWKYYCERQLQAQIATPNAAHYALAELARWKPHTFTISQNIDGLSQKAGHVADKLAEIHGSLFHTKCSNEACAYVQSSTCPEASDIPTSQIANFDEAFTDAARCPQCASLLRPGVVWFGEPVLQLDRVEQWLSSVPRVDLMLVIGTSARVFPAAEYIHHAREKGAYIAHFNLERDNDHMSPGDCNAPRPINATPTWTHTSSTTATSSFELQDYPDDTAPAAEIHVPRAQSALPPTDTGYRAWLCLAGCFAVNALIWGFAFSFGVLQRWYTTHAPFAAQPAGIAAVGTTATGLMYVLMPAYLWAYRRRPGLRRWSTGASLPLAAAALVGASFARSVPQLLATQGVVYALAGNALVAPTITYLDEWFVRRKGLAVGVMWAGDGCGGVLMPLVMQPLLEQVGFRWTLRIVAGIMVVLMAPLLFFLQPRVPPSAAHTTPPVNTSFLRTPLFWAFEITTIAQALGYFLPTNYLPTFAEALGLSANIGSLTVLLANLAAVLGCVAVGVLVDRFDVTSVVLGISVGAGAVVLLVWGFATSLVPLLVFSLLYGLFASAFSTAWSGMVKDIQTHYEGADANIVFGFLIAGRGIGAIVSGPLSEALLGRSSDIMSHSINTVYGSAYARLVVFSGCTALAGGATWFVRKAGFI